jgi:AcrR family transcriptional regulator
MQRARTRPLTSPASIPTRIEGRNRPELSRVRQAEVARERRSDKGLRMSEDAGAVVAQIVEAASAQFLHAGYSQVSTEEIARSIGRSKKTLYKHFATKEELLHAVLARADRTVQEEIAVLLTSQSRGRLERVRAVLGVVALRLATVHRVLLSDLLTASPVLGQQCWRGRRQALGRILWPLLSEAAADGVLRSDLEVEQVLSVFFSCIEGLVSTGHPGEAETLFDPLVTLLVDGLRKR